MVLIRGGLFVLRLVLQAKSFYMPCLWEWLGEALPHLEDALHSWMVRGAGASTSGEPAADSWKSFDERVLLEPMPDSSASSVNGPPSHTEAADSAQTSVDPNLDPEELMKKKVELHTLVREQLRHYCDRGRPKWQLSNEGEVNLFSAATDQILSGLEIGSTVSEHEDWIDHLKSNPTTLYELFKGYKIPK
ncbi:hypothetical protein TSUD_198850 [Trifolium subterraneum]|uniref:Uncharacterized protein n=1 Tax=Trifolium subterraneum TaxID=3900 RepID=A0A2Z6LME8_TRISU|nr:hypothetical protein TSUD_198850 [Trifolium subterraneum]